MHIKILIVSCCAAVCLVMVRRINWLILLEQKSEQLLKNIKIMKMTMFLLALFPLLMS